MTVLSVQGLCKSFGGVVAARDVSFDVQPGELLALIGPNGAGKTTTFNMVGGQLRPDAGAVVLDGADVTRLTPREKLRRGVGRTFQVAQTFPSMTVAENVQMALISHAGETRAVRPNARRRHREEAVALLAPLGMDAFADRPGSTLAYGDVKRVELAIALASRPKLLLMDEPTAGMGAVFADADRILVLVRGEIIAAGSPEAVRANARVREVYLGDSGAAAALAGRAPA